LNGRAWAIDHNNIDANRPLSFDDAEPVAFRETSLERGLAASLHHLPGVAAEVEYLRGFTLNGQLNLAAETSVADQDDVVHLGPVSAAALYNFNRETLTRPARAVRADLFLPTGLGSEASDLRLRLRGIASQRYTRFGPFDRAHLNVDLNVAPLAGRGERILNPEAILGFTRPLGYPHRFTTTGLAELALQLGPESGKGPILRAGIGIRRQVKVNAVVDVGVQSDLLRFNGASGNWIRLVAGYSQTIYTGRGRRGRSGPVSPAVPPASPAPPAESPN
jgi:hypothetical protein